MGVFLQDGLVRLTRLICVAKIFFVDKAWCTLVVRIGDFLLLVYVNEY